MRIMKFNRFIALSIILVCICANTSFSFAAKRDESILLIYPRNVETNGIKVLDIIVSQFIKNIDTIESDKEINDIDSYDYIIYYGENNENISSYMKDKLENYNGKLIGIGHNVEQLESKFSFIKLGEEVSVNNISYNNKNGKANIAHSVREIIEINSGNLLGQASKGEFKTPWFVSNENEKVFYISLTNIFSEWSLFFREALVKCLDYPKSTNKISLRLEDINPTRDPKTLMDIAKYLKSKDIPYMVVLIPVYKDVKNNKVYHLKDYPEIIEVLRYMQDNGGSIVMHGYTHQYRDSETGEGFEFWDAESDSPLDNPDNISETDYIKSRLENGIDELTAHKLYPIAFEAPHYAISQNGYKIVSEYFSNYVGQIQLSDDTMNSSFETMGVSNPSYMNGMTIIPENLGYLDEDNIENGIKSIQNDSKYYNNFSNVIMSAFYHPHLGIDNLKKLVEILESNENVEWFDLKDVDATVKTSNINIEVVNGSLNVVKLNAISKYKIINILEVGYVSTILMVLFLIVIYLFRGTLSIKKHNV